MDSVKRIVSSPKELRNLDVDSYKLKLIKLSQKMQDLKESCPIQSLMEEKVELEDELREFEPNLQKYEKLQRGSTFLTSSDSINKGNRKGNVEYKDVNDFHALVAVTGHTENWSMDDHLFFLKMRKKCESVPALVAAIQRKCPDLSADVIVNHEAWYKHYEDLREQQKATVKKWREQKELEKKKNIDDAKKEFEDCKTDKDVPASEIVVEEKVSVSKKTKSSGSETRSTNSSAGSSNNEKKELIKRWKTEKECKRLMDEEQMKTRMRLKKEMEESRRKKRQEKIQSALEEYKKRKSLEDVSKKCEELLRKESNYDATLVKAFRKQDREFTRKRKDRISRSKRPGKFELVNIRRVELVEARNCSALLNSTEIWREKCKFDDSSKRSDEIRCIKDVPRICIRWRNEDSEDLEV